MPQDSIIENDNLHYEHSIAHSSLRAVLFHDVVSIALPMSLSQLAQFSFIIVMMVFAGRLGVQELGAVSVSFSIINATAYAIGCGLSGALEALLSCSYGDDPRNKMYGTYAQRMFFILLIFSVPLTPFFMYLEPLLGFAGQPPHVVTKVGKFGRISVLGVPFLMLLELIRRYYVSQRRSQPVFFALAAAAVFNPILQLFLVNWMGYIGIPIGWVVLMMGLDTALIWYLWWSGLHRRTWGGWSREAFQNWSSILRFAVPSLGIAFSEWTVVEINTLCAGYSSPVGLAAFAVSNQVANLCWSIVSGLFIASTVLVGNCVGARNANLGKKYAVVSSVLVLLVSSCNAVLIYTYREQIPYIFTTDTVVVDEFASMSPYFLSYHVLDSMQTNFLAILRGCGLQSTGVFIVFVTMAIVGTPLGIFLMFWKHYGVVALWIGPLVGRMVFGTPAYLYVLLRRNEWDALRANLDRAEEPKCVAAGPNGNTSIC
ncbi:putative membrane transporter protein [Trypanosoma vivax]|uniref:Putative membrane transporter protein n=1 Tax=Trypanosoma vivax (strain Y486) TaxID=1055687 RepID=G0U377_TRYVY|nr:putative membrane transporter protein [Trypanosoma vivax]CCC50732.1 putative membrane transporter protein [Trypanosoma vivax Y486]